MSSFEFVLGLVGILVGYKLISIYLQQRSEGERASHEQAQGVAIGTRLDELESRVQVLERIVTDQRLHLKREFENLGD